MTDLINGVDNLRMKTCLLEIDVSRLLSEMASLRSEVQDLRDEVRQLREQLTAFHGDPHP